MKKLDADEQIFLVNRRSWVVMGWISGLLGLAVLLMAPFVRGTTPFHVFAALFLVPYGISRVLGARNVRQIVVSPEAIIFQPIGTEIRFSEIREINVPGWADRHDNPPGMMTSVDFKPAEDRSRFIPGVVLQGKRRGRLYLDGSESDRLFALLRRRLPSG